MAELKTVYIYALIDPETREFRYIGKTTRPKERLQNHMNEKSNCHRSHWLQSLKAKGLKPEMVIIEEIRGAWPWQFEERYWIEYAKRCGCRLTNNTSGGDGVPDLPKEAREKMRQTWIGRKHSPESLKKIGDASRGRVHSIATRQKMSNAHKGRQITWVGKISERLRKINEADLVHIKGRLSNGEKVCDLAREYKVHRTTMSKIKKGSYLNESY